MVKISGGRRGTRTPSLRFWRPLLYQLSYSPVDFIGFFVDAGLELQNLGDVTGANGFAAFTNGETLTRFHCNGFLQFYLNG